LSLPNAVLDMMQAIKPHLRYDFKGEQRLIHYMCSSSHIVELHSAPINKGCSQFLYVSKRVGFFLVRSGRLLGGGSSVTVCC